MSTEKKIKDYIQEGINEELIKKPTDKFWTALKNSGTTLWLDTGDIDEAREVWSGDMEALTTNNTLINKVIQKGIYDEYIVRTQDILSGLDRDKQIMEMAFILNARHGLRLTELFGGLVSVELHTATAHDVDEIVSYGLRYRDICPDKFIIKVPYTVAGLIGARLLRDKGVKINFTLGFSARQNVIAANIARPDYLNVFLGRIGAYIADNKLGDGSNIGEKSVIETQKHICEIRKAINTGTKLIAASIRHHDQLEMLAGVDVFTMPPKVAASGYKELKGNFSSNLTKDYEPSLNIDKDREGIKHFWEVDGRLSNLARLLGNNLIPRADELHEIFLDEGREDMFPILTEDEKDLIGKEGKIPVRSTWIDKLSAGKIAPDTLLNLAGLASFTADQAALDARIDSILG